MEPPPVRYARSGDVNVAYATVGDGPFDLVFVSGWVQSTLDIAWEGPAADTLSKLASFSRLILFDKRGTGLSNRTIGIPDLTVKDIVSGSGIQFRERGQAALKGVPGEWSLFAVESA